MFYYNDTVVSYKSYSPHIPDAKSPRIFVVFTRFSGDIFFDILHFFIRKSSFPHILDEFALLTLLDFSTFPGIFEKITVSKYL